MYNRYLPGDAPYEPVRGPGPFRPPKNTQRPSPPHAGGENPLDWLVGGSGGLLKNFRLEKPDSGDVLLVLILLFLFLERDDNLELVITLGALLVFGLLGTNGETENQEGSSPTT